jgi:uncharacterized RDD family membrane protein YckC
MKTLPNTNAPRATFFKRLAAMVYDTLVACAVGILAALIMSAMLVALLSSGVLSMGEFDEPNQAIAHSLGYTLIIQCWSGIWIVAFFLGFWKKGGQTIGMRAWRLRLYSLNEQPVTWKRLAIRLICSLGGIGTLAVVLDRKNKLALQDRASNIEILQLTQAQNDHKNW